MHAMIGVAVQWSLVVQYNTKGKGATIKAQDAVDKSCSIQVLTYWNVTLQIPLRSQSCKNANSMLALLSISLLDTPRPDWQYFDTPSILHQWT